MFSFFHEKLQRNPVSEATRTDAIEAFKVPDDLRVKLLAEYNISKNKRQSYGGFLSILKKSTIWVIPVRFLNFAHTGISSRP